MASGSLKVDLRDLAPFKAYIWDMRRLIDRLRVEANPLAEELERKLDRLMAFGKDDRVDGA